MVRRWVVIPVLVLTLIALCVGGCAGMRPSDDAILRALHNGDYGVARSIAMREKTRNVRDKRYLLDRQLVLWTALAEGDMPAAAGAADYTYDQLRVQGVNAGTDFGRFFLGDQAVRVWKGEPFEQAGAFAAVAAVDGVNGDWGNMRASAIGATFQLRELADVEGSDKNGVTVVASDFEPGYALAALGEQRLGLRAEMEESLRALVTVNPELGSLADRIRSGGDNAAFIIDYGLGPAKVAAGEDGSIAAFEARTASGSQPVVVSVNGRAGEAHPVLTDYNRLARDLKWTSLEEQRRAKSAIGTGMVAAGIGLAALSDDDGAQWAGIGVALAGLALKATAGADTRQCVGVPQRSYLALASLPTGVSSVSIEIEGLPASRVVLPAVEMTGGFRVFYVRLPVRERAWAGGGRVVYANDSTGAMDRASLPWVLGGRCVRSPSRELLREYRAAGLPDWVTVGDLRIMYEQEGVAVSGWNAGVPNGVHVLEGGDALYSPTAGSAGFVRLFCQDHPAYAARGEMALRILDDMR